jgi:hypothetical protein
LGTVAILFWLNFCLKVDEKRIISMNNWIFQSIRDSAFGQLVRAYSANLDVEAIWLALSQVAFFIALTAPPQRLLGLVRLGGPPDRRLLAARDPDWVGMPVILIAEGPRPE